MRRMRAPDASWWCRGARSSCEDGRVKIVTDVQPKVGGPTAQRDNVPGRRLYRPRAVSVSSKPMADQVHVLQYVEHDGGDFPLRPGSSYIAGRSAEADLVIREDTVSRKHARFFFLRGRTWVRDLGSRNGTLVNGERVDERRLSVGDRIQIGAHLFKMISVSADSVAETQPEESSGRSMSGNIRDIPLADVLQWLATSRKTGTLRVQGPSRGFLTLKNGTVCYARIDGRPRLGPEKALLRMLSWQEGGFGLESGLEDVPEGDEISPSLESMLMEAARQQDELAHLADRHGLPAGKVTIAKPAPEAWSKLEPAQVDTLQAIYENESWADVLDASELDDVALTKALVALKKAKYVSY